MNSCCLIIQSDNSASCEWIMSNKQLHFKRFWHPSVPHHYIKLKKKGTNIYVTNCLPSWKHRRLTRCLLHTVNDPEPLTLFFTNLLLSWQRAKSGRQVKTRLTHHLSASDEFDLNINPAISVGEKHKSAFWASARSPSLPPTPCPSIHPPPPLLIPPCCFLEGILCKMWWKRLIQIIRWRGPSALHSWYVCPAFGGLIRKANTDNAASYLRTIVADELEG